jgi:predicted deacylase
MIAPARLRGAAIWNKATCLPGGIEWEDEDVDVSRAQESNRVDALDTIEMPRAGTVQRGHLRFSHPSMHEWSWPYTVIRGSEDGPQLALLSGVHPTEYPPIEANIRLMQQLDPSEIRGTIISLPIVNPPAFLTRTPFVCPIDEKNPNRAFPGDPDGSFTDVLTHAIFQGVIAPADVLLDLHGGDMVEDLIPFSIYSVSGEETVDQASADIGRAFGLPYLIAHRPQPGGLGGTTVQAAAAAGVPGIIAEAGGRGVLTGPETQLLVEGVRRVLQHLGMLSGGVPESRAITEVTSFTWLTSPAEGMWYPTATVGESVAEGQTIGHIRDLFGTLLADIASPHGGIVLFVTSSPAMQENGLVMAVGAP